jgi:transcription antitermination factor NusG
LGEVSRPEILARRQRLTQQLSDSLDRLVWHVGLTRPLGEFLTERMVSERAMACYCPARLVEQRVSHRRVMAQRLRPLFPSYVFVGADAFHDIRRGARDTPLVGLLARHEQNGDGEDVRIPVTLAFDVVRGLMTEEIGGRFDRSHGSLFAAGDQVDVDLGNGLTLRGLIKRLGRSQRAEVVVRMLGENRLVKIDLAQLAKVE